MADTSLYIGIDLGTSGVRAVAINHDEAVLAQATVPLPPPQADGAHREQDARLWWMAVRDCLAALTRQIDTQQVAAIAVDGTSATLLLTDAQGAPLGPALLYNDARATVHAQFLACIAPHDTAAQGPTCTLAKLLWLQEQGPTGNPRHVVHQADWIATQLTGRHTNPVTDINNALKLGYDAERQCWPEWLLSLLTQRRLPHSVLPEVVPPGTVIGTLADKVARELGLPAATRVVAGTTDSTASFIATGAGEIGAAVTALGSTLVLKVIADKPVYAPAYGVYSQPLVIDDKLRWLVGGASNSGGAVLLNYFSLAQIQAMTAQLSPDLATGLDYYPLPAIGERFPLNDPQLRPRLEPRPADDVRFFQAMLEGIARIEARGYRLLAELGAPYPISVLTTGGGAGNFAWTRIRQRALGVPVLPAPHTEAAFGCARLARRSASAAG